MLLFKDIPPRFLYLVIFPPTRQYRRQAALILWFHWGGINEGLKDVVAQKFESLWEKHPKCKDLAGAIMVFLEVDMEFIGKIADQHHPELSIFIPTTIYL